MWRRQKQLQPTPWRSGGARPRVLIEHHDPAIGVAIANLLASEGYEVANCSGPDDKVGVCSLVETGVCSRAVEADVVFYGLRVSDEDDRQVLRSLKDHFPGTPVIVEMPMARIALYREELEDCLPVAQPVTRDSLLTVIERALR